MPLAYQGLRRGLMGQAPTSGAKTSIADGEGDIPPDFPHPQPPRLPEPEPDPEDGGETDEPPEEAPRRPPVAPPPPPPPESFTPLAVPGSFARPGEPAGRPYRAARPGGPLSFGGSPVAPGLSVSGADDEPGGEGEDDDLLRALRAVGRL